MDVTESKIDLAKLRAWAEQSEANPVGYPWFETGAPDIETTLALIDAVEAALAIDIPTLNCALGWLYNETSEDTTDTDAHLVRLRDILARFR